MPSMRLLTTAFALGRLGFGLGLLARPEAVASGWIGEDAGRGAVKVVLRGLGARDVVLSGGALAALATLVAPADSLPPNARWGTVALGGGSAMAGAALLAGLKR